ncbi:hypothetical protein V8G54_004708 [Vigna mungo]|uniref:Uncharacterized protein n=1 Tax=Vigna mungo TaxID=3915 RepID=A0AAQ3SG88_VIGMU
MKKTKLKDQRQQKTQQILQTDQQQAPKPQDPQPESEGFPLRLIEQDRDTVGRVKALPLAGPRNHCYSSVYQRLISARKRRTSVQARKGEKNENGEMKKGILGLGEKKKAMNEGMSCTWTRFSKERGVKNSSRTCEKLDRVGMAATWLCQSFVSAFLASLEWCSCFLVDTTDGPDADSTSATSLILDAEKDDSAT